MMKSNSNRKWSRIKLCLFNNWRAQGSWRQGLRCCCPIPSLSVSPSVLSQFEHWVSCPLALGGKELPAPPNWHPTVQVTERVTFFHYSQSKHQGRSLIDTVWVRCLSLGQSLWTRGWGVCVDQIWSTGPCLGPGNRWELWTLSPPRTPGSRWGEIPLGKEGQNDKTADVYHTAVGPGPPQKEKHSNNTVGLTLHVGLE